VILGDAVEGEARDAALMHGAIARQVAAGRFIIGERAVRPPWRCSPAARPRLPCGARAAAGGTRSSPWRWRSPQRRAGIHALGLRHRRGRRHRGQCGRPHRAGHNVTGGQGGVNLKERLADNDGYGAFAALGDLVITGPTLTNVNDFRAILVLEGVNGQA